MNILFRFSAGRGTQRTVLYVLDKHKRQLRAIKAATSSLDAIFGRVQVNISRSENVFETFHHYCL